MELLLFLGLNLTLFWGFSALGPSDSAEEEKEPIDPDVTNVGFALSTDGETVTGTDGDDFMSIEDYAGLDGAIGSIEAGAGDDVIDLIVDSDAGDDPLRDGISYDSGFPMEGGSIDGGDGNDVIRLDYTSNATVTGGNGDDDILVRQADTDRVHLYGGNGDDTLDGSVMDNGALYGGAGDDLMMTARVAEGGAGYTKGVYGGEGDDTLQADATTVFDFDDLNGGGIYRFRGEEGRDVLELIVAEGTVDDTTPIPGDTSDPPSTYAESLGDVDINSVELLEFSDFTPNEDQVVLNVSSLNDDFELGSITMVERLDRFGVIETVITVSYQSEDFLPRELSVVLKAAGVTWDDVVLNGADRSVLVPLTNAA